MRNVVLTCLLTAELDPQRAGSRMAADSGLLAALRRSVAAHERNLIVLHDCLGDRDGDLTTFTRVPPGGNPYWIRWAHYRDWLRNHPEAEWVWCVDGTDVEMLNDPFGRMRRDALYCGAEERTINDPQAGSWMRRGATPEVCDWLDGHPDEQILNMGILGGHRGVLLPAVEALADRVGESDWELGAWQQIARARYADRITTGPTVHTRFQADERTGAWWKHK